MINKYTFIFIQLFISSTASACAFGNSTQPLPLFILSGILISLSFFLLLRSINSKRSVAIIIACILIIPVVFVALYSDSFPCGTTAQLLATLELSASILVFFLSCLVWFWVKTIKPKN